MNDFKYSNVTSTDLRMKLKDIGENGCDLVKKLNEDPSINTVLIYCYDTEHDPTYVINLMFALKGTDVKDLFLTGYAYYDHFAQYLAEGLKETNIKYLTICGCHIGSIGVKYLADALKDSCINHLTINNDEIGNDGTIYLAEHLKDTSLIYLDIRGNVIGYEGLKLLTDALKDTNITHLDLCHIFLHGLYGIRDREFRYLSKNLKNTCLTYLNLRNSDIHHEDTISRLKQDLIDSQITRVEIGLNIEEEINEVTSKNKEISHKIQNAFQKLVVQNTLNDNLEFIIPNETDNLDIGEYLYLVKTLNDNPNVKGHLFDMISKHKFKTYPNIIQNINEFVVTVSDKFNIFFNNKFLDLINLLDNYTDLVKRCEDLGLTDIVKNLLLHRELYYVDDNQEILHPYIYKMLNKYGMPLYNEQIDPKKKNDIISYYQNHTEIDGAHEIIDLLISLHNNINH